MKTKIIKSNTIRSLHVSYSDIAGGAARAAFRLHKALHEEGISSCMLVQQKQSNEPYVFGPNGKLSSAFNLLWSLCGGLPTLLQKSKNIALHSSALLPTGRVKTINNMDVDIVNLHWISWETLSIYELARIKKPTVWTLHDMWAFCGTEHYVPDENNTRWQLGYEKNNRHIDDRGIDLDRIVWGIKQKAWGRPVQIVTPSHWLAKCVKNSALMHDWPVEVIPNPLDTTIFKPLDSKFARLALNLPNDRKYILFGAIGGGTDPRKGFDLLMEALVQIADQSHNNLECIVFGQSKPVTPPKINLPVHWMGHIYDDCALSLIYNAADVVVVPSRQENLPQIATEAQACGRPVVAFNTTGFSDVIIQGETGYLAQPFDTTDLAQGIKWVLEDEERYYQLSNKARQRAVDNWAYPVVAARYQILYQSLLVKFNNGMSDS